MPTTHYQVTIDPSKVNGPTGDELKSLSSGKDITYDYWLDAKNLPLQLKYAFEVQGRMATATAQMRDWGVVRPLTAPPADQLITLEQAGLGG
ncbi:hypothetical protein [Microbacterium rhizosphaerae]|uniref:Uncharacterized protein n=2 Tax=Microbacterium rhizosphaerae TaxID=1678237 RepID=A0ABZ0SNQ7_9MICO|nr:hypothetical protein [Microbacterium rhizosphaerae]WPR90594.1 hypothetical protein SM116_04685 [Microbacterium rhizosphaerae]